MKKLSFVLVEYKSIDDLTVCLHSIKEKLEAKDYEITVVSNSLYQKEICNKLELRFDFVSFIFSKANLGYSAGVNAGIKNSLGQYIVVMNTDIILIDSEIIKMCCYLDKNLEVGMLGPKLIENDETVLESCRRFPTIKTFLYTRTPLGSFVNSKKERAHYVMDEFDKKSIKSVEWISGGCMVVRKSAIDDVGLMDERFFLYLEDVEWCRRFWEKGWKVKFYPFVKIVHNAQYKSVGNKSLINKSFFHHISSSFKYFSMHYGKHLPKTR